MTERLVLIFAYHYPPENEIGGARPARFAKYLSRFGYTCRVFTAAEQPVYGDPSIQFVPDPFLTRSRKDVSWQLERAVRRLFFPGEMGLRWSYRAAEAACKYISNHPAAQVTILSTFPPLGAHLAGWQLARPSGLSWLADCRDPIADEFADGCHTPSQRRLYRWMERAVARNADAVIANTDAAQARWQERFPSFRDKFHVIWNGFDPEERVPPLPVESSQYKVLSHVGELYHGRNATPILESIARLISAKQLPKDGVRVRLIGPAQTECLPSPEFRERAKPEGWLDLMTERIPKIEARQIAQTSNALLLLQAGSADQVPAKLFEYLQIGRPILAFLQPDSSTERILERCGVPYRCVYPGSAPEVADRIVANFFDLPASAVAPSPWFEEQFNAECQTRILDSIIRLVQNDEPSPKLTTPIPRAEVRAKRPLVTGSTGAQPYRPNEERQKLA